MLRACDDRLCNECFEDNEAKLRLIRASDNKSPAAEAVGPAGIVSDYATAPVCSKFKDSSVDTSLGCSAGNCSVAPKPTDLKCDVCSRMFHGRCLGFSSDVMEKLLSIVDVTGWVCQCCRERARIMPHTQTLQYKVSEFDHIKNTLNNIQGELSTIKSSVLAKKPVSWPSLEKSTKTHIVAAVHADFENSQKRKSNVVVHGLHSSDDIDDIEQFLTLCEDHLHIKPCIVREKCRRLGKQVPGKTQPLLIVLTNESAASDLLHDAKRLRHCGDQYTEKHVFINPDLTPAQARLAYERRQRRRDRRPTNDLHTDSDVLEDHITSVACPQSVSVVSPTSKNSS